MSLASLQSLPSFTEAWTADDDGQSNPLFFLSATGVVVDETGAYAVGLADGYDKLISVNPSTGAVSWAVTVPDAEYDSLSTPTIDRNNGTVLVAAGNKLTAVRTNGTVAWQRTLSQDVVNASPTVTSDLGPRDRAFIVDFSAASLGVSNLYCINVDPYDAVNNPYQPGDIVWTRSLGARAAGSTPAYLDGVVYVGAIRTPSSTAGQIMAFDATSTAAGGPAPTWTFTNVINAGFFGGLCVRDGTLYASSYAYSGNQLSANTVKLNTSTGALIWSTPSNRTDAMPVVARGRVYVSGGLPQSVGAGYGTFPTVQAFDASTGTLVWDSALDSWNDTNHNSQVDMGEYLSIGGWSIQPFVITSASAVQLVVGVMPEVPDDVFGPSVELVAIDLTATPTATPPYYGIVVDEYAGAGSSPAYFDGMIYVVGPDGLTALGP
ncbi:MAG: PQQ-binding-like beta-propeller repeat protein [Phycisphaerales bacterium]